MGAIVESKTVRAELTRYEVPGWGVGELWTDGAVVLAHDFDYGAVLRGSAEDEPGPAADPRSVSGSAPAAGPSPPMGVHDPPIGTVAARGSREGHGSVASRHRTKHSRAECHDAAVDARSLADRIAGFFAGEYVGFGDVRLDLETFTPFQRAVAETLREVPRGEVIAYGELAALAGYPNAQRAVGTFCAHNRFAVLVPCHRVVAADGIGSYGSAGRKVKRRLLALEGVSL